ncbi:MAG: adenosylmethionine--8-amino-7-oxononanoate transaminase [Bacteroidia bacterium]|nr:adenosylmethionine--8-amino-7-oxononanoate transaminase [Bacteroidia bacterium]
MYASDNIWRPFTSLVSKSKPLKIVKAEGLYLYTEDGNKIADLNASWWVNIHGHSHPYISEAIRKQLEKFGHVMFSDCTHEAAETLAKKIVNFLPQNHKKIFFSDNGSTAVEVALKISRQYFYLKGEQRGRYLAFHGGYHGDTFGGMSAAERNVFNAAFRNLLFDTFLIPLPDDDKIPDILNTIEIEHKKNPFIAFIYEPLVQGAAGMKMYEARYLEQIINRCSELGILTIADEVMTGFGRTGTFLASDQMKSKPDMVCLSKGLTGGFMPLGLTSVSDKVVEVFENENPMHTFYHGHSYTAYALACSAAAANIELFEKENTLQKVQRMESAYRNCILQLRGVSGIQNLRCKGGIFAAEADIQNYKGEDYLNPLKGKMQEYFLERGMLIRPLGNTFYLIPPYCIREEEIYSAADCFRNFVEGLER